MRDVRARLSSVLSIDSRLSLLPSFSIEGRSIDLMKVSLKLISNEELVETGCGV
ncbi:hypothetical protein D3C81_1234860 [compost metagenome]